MNTNPFPDDLLCALVLMGSVPRLCGFLGKAGASTNTFKTQKEDKSLLVPNWVGVGGGSGGREPVKAKLLNASLATTYYLGFFMVKSGNAEHLVTFTGGKLRQTQRNKIPCASFTAKSSCGSWGVNACHYVLGVEREGPPGPASLTC